MGRSQTWSNPVFPTPIQRAWKRIIGGSGALGPGLFPKGNIWFVDSSNPQALDSGGNPISPGPRNQGTDPATPFATLRYAIGGAVDATSHRTPSGVMSNNGDVVIVAPGHVETIVTALTMALVGVSVIFLGNAAGDHAQMNLTATASQLLVTGAGNHFVAPYFTTGIDAVVAAMQVQAADCTIEDFVLFDAPAKATLVQLLTTTAATRLKIKGYRYHPSTTGTQKTEAIRIVGVTDFEMDDAYIVGDFTTGVVNFVTTASPRPKLRNCYLNNLSASPAPAISVGAAGVLTGTTGMLMDCQLAIASGAHWITASHVFVADCATGEMLPGTTPPALLTSA